MRKDKQLICLSFLIFLFLKAMDTGGFKATDDSTYDGLRDVAKSLHLDLSKLK